MAFSTLNTFNDYEGNAIATVFPVTFKFIDNDDLLVQVIDETTEVATELVEGVSYNVTGGNPGNSITTVAAPAVGKRLRIDRVTPKTQGQAFDTNQTYLTPAVTRAADKVTMIAQEAACDASQGIKLSLIEENDVDTRMEKAEADCTVVWNPTGKKLINGPTVTQVANAQGYAEAAETAETAAETAQGLAETANTAAQSAKTAAQTANTAAQAALATISAIMAMNTVGSRSGPTNISAAGGLAFGGTNMRNTWYVTATGDIDISAALQIALGTVEGQELKIIMVTAGSDTLKFEDGNGLVMNGSYTMVNNSMLVFHMDLGLNKWILQSVNNV